MGPDQTVTTTPASRRWSQIRPSQRGHFNLSQPSLAAPARNLLSDPVLNLTGVTFLDARGNAALVEVAHQVNQHGRRLALVAALRTRRLLHLTELDQVITVMDW